MIIINDNNDNDIYIWNRGISWQIGVFRDRLGYFATEWGYLATYRGISRRIRGELNRITTFRRITWSCLKNRECVLRYTVFSTLPLLKLNNVGMEYNIIWREKLCDLLVGRLNLLHDVGMHDVGMHDVGMHDVGMHDVGMHDVGMRRDA